MLLLQQLGEAGFLSKLENSFSSAKNLCMRSKPDFTTSETIVLAAQYITLGSSPRIIPPSDQGLSLLNPLPN